MDHFPTEIHGALGWYVYRLIDPRTGHTFYVGKGRGDRLFQHARGALAESDVADDDIMDDLKTTIIREIIKERLKVMYVVHRHGIETQETAYEVEAAVIDCYAGLTNIVGGHASADLGCRTVEQIVATYAAPPLKVLEPLILIFIGRALEERGDVYDSVRAAWRMNRAKAESHKLVLAYDVRGLVVGAYRPEQWLDANMTNFPFLPRDFTGERIGFIGHRADDVWDTYIDRKVPPRQRGAQTAFRYLQPQSAVA